MRESLIDLYGSVINEIDFNIDINVFYVVPNYILNLLT